MGLTLNKYSFAKEDDINSSRSCHLIIKEQTDGFINSQVEKRTLYWKILLLLNFPIADSFFLSFNKKIIRK